MKERPIIFSTEMVKAILDGRKTQTRRIIKPQPKPHKSGGWIWEKVGGLIATASGKIYKQKMLSRNPYGKPGDRLWVRETWAWLDNSDFDAESYVEYRADNPNAKYPGEWPEDEAKGNPEAPKWKSPYHMFKKYARIWLEIVNIRVERLQDIDDYDCEAEGIKQSWTCINPDIGSYARDNNVYDDYRVLWDKLNGKKHPWESNPWVWIIEFKRLTRNDSKAPACDIVGCTAKPENGLTSKRASDGSDGAAHKGRTRGC